MIYLNNKNIKELNQNWAQNIEVIRAATQCIGANDTVQPIKPYLRYGDSKNRIIAMPAFVGGDINKSGIKWIASFPDNVQKGMDRAHSVIVLNEAETGRPVGILNSGAISAIRTASVSGFMIQQFLEQRRSKGLTLGIVGFGPVGKTHLEMCSALFADSIDNVLLYDLNTIAVPEVQNRLNGKITLADSWQQAYLNADIFITCTVSKDRYIDLEPKKGSFHLNVSLRDYKPSVFQWFAKAMVVDDWEEVCRENTDIEMFHKTNGLHKDDVNVIQDFLTKDYLNSLDKEQAVMFNPMGMAAFDIAMADHYVALAQQSKTGLVLQA